MDKYSVSVVLADSCCNRNYLLSQIIGRVVWYRGRKFHWEVTYSDERYNLFCNNRLIGDLYIDKILIHDENSKILQSKSDLLSLIALFNLYPL